MTLADLRSDVWHAIGKPTDLDPASDTQYSSGPLLTWTINEAQRQVALWRDPQRGRHLRFNRLLSEVFFRAVYTSETLDDAATSTTAVILPSTDVGTQDDRYNGWVLEISGEQKLIVDYTGSTRTATVHDAFSSTWASGKAYKLYKRFWYLFPSTHAWITDHITLPSTSDRYRAEGNLLEVLNILDLDQEREVEPAERDEKFPQFITDTGDPAEYVRLGNRIIMDRAPQDTRWFRMEYYRLPTDMSAATDEPELPEQFHYAIALWGIWWGQRRRMDPELAYAAKRDFYDYMSTHLTEGDVVGERSSGQMELGIKE